MVDTGGDIHVMRVLIANLLRALSLEVLKEVVEQDKVYQRPKEVVKAGRKPKNRKTLGPTKTFDGICLYLPERLKKDVWTRDCGHPQHDSPIKLTVKGIGPSSPLLGDWKG
jgi:hypothetical protein